MCLSKGVYDRIEITVHLVQQVNLRFYIIDWCGSALVATSPLSSRLTEIKGNLMFISASLYKLLDSLITLSQVVYALFLETLKIRMHQAEHDVVVDDPVHCKGVGAVTVRKIS